MADGSRFIHNTQKLGGTEQRRLGSSFAWVTLLAIFFFCKVSPRCLLYFDWDPHHLPLLGGRFRRLLQL